MALFKKKQDTKQAAVNSSRLPDLPQLPRLPHLPEAAEEEAAMIPSATVHQLPKFPNDYLGQKFSQNTIKDAVTGKKEGGVFADDFAEENEMQMMQAPQRIPSLPIREKMSIELPETNPRMEMKERPMMREMPAMKETPIIRERPMAIEKEEPIFIRMDKFEEGLNALEVARKQIAEIDKLLKDIKKVKEDEDKELASWEKEISTAREQIEKIDRDIFSKIQ